MRTSPPVPAPSRTGRWRSLALGSAALVLLTVGALPAASPAVAADALLSQGRLATASSEEGAGTPASAAVDGSLATRWSSERSVPQWLEVDLGARSTLSSVVLDWEGAYAKSFQLQVTDTPRDPASWLRVYGTSSGSGGRVTLPVSGAGRYVRVLATERGTGWGVSLHEFQVFGAAASGGAPAPAPSPSASAQVCGTANAALNRSAKATSREGAGYAESLAFDGNRATRWASLQADPQSLQVDLGSSQTLCRVGLVWEGAYATAFELQVTDTPDDAGSWRTLYSTTTGRGGVQDIPVSGTGQYLRMHGTKRVGGYGYSLWEMTAHTSSGTTTPSPAPSPTPTTAPSPTPSAPGSPVLLSYGKQATASSSQDEGGCSRCVPAKAVDQDPATRWSTSSQTGWTDPGWIYVDLGARASVSSVVLQWDYAYASHYLIEVSDDTLSWQKIYETTTSKGFKQTLTGLSGSGRYVRVHGKARGTAYGYSLWEFQVYGTGGSPVAPPAPPPDVALPATRLVFGDEFDDAAGTTPNPAKWTAQSGTGNNAELQYYTANRNATTDGAGNLVIEARKEVTAGTSCPRDPLTGSTTCQYTSGRINTSKTFAFTYGRAEARIKVSGTKGLWPAFWMLGANFPTAGWPASGEIDVMEHVGKVPGSVYSTLHAPAYFGAGGMGSPYTMAGDFSQDFHTYAVDWNASGMAFSVDGDVFLRLSKAQVEATRGPWVYDHPFYLILNNAVGGEWPGPPDATTVLPQRMLIDYVRVFQ